MKSGNKHGGERINHVAPPAVTKTVDHSPKHGSGGNPKHADTHAEKGAPDKAPE